MSTFFTLYQERYGQKFDAIARAMVVLCAFVIPMGTAHMSIASGLLLLFWLAGGNFREKFSLIRANSVALSALLILALLAVGLLYTSGDKDTALDIFGNYKKLLFIPLIISLGLSEQWRKRAIAAFMLGMTIILVISYMKYFQLLQPGPPGGENTVFKNRITHSIFMAFYSYLLAHAAINMKPYRWIFISLAILATYNLFILITGRTGYIVFACLSFLICFQYFRWKGFFIASFSILILFSSAYFGSERFSNRINQSIINYQEHVDGDYDHLSGLRYRLEFYDITSELILQKPFFGYGTGSLVAEYTRLAEPRGMAITHNPHNEFMMMTVQLGIVGLAALILMLYLQWRASISSPRFEGLIMQGLLVTFVSGSMLNSLLLDSAEGKFFTILFAIMLCVYADARKKV